MDPLTFAADPVALADAGDGPVWIELGAAGTHYGRQGSRAVELTDADIDSMHRGFALVKAEGWFPRGAPIGVNHASMSGALDAESTKALAYVTDTRVEIRDGRKVLMGLADYTEEGRRRVRAGEFQAISLEAIPATAAKSKRTGELLGEWALIGATLTNHPFVPGLAAVAASEGVTTERHMTEITTALGLAEDADTATLLAEIATLRASAGKVEALTEALATVEADRNAMAVRLTELAEADKVRTLDAAVESGRCSMGERDDYWKALTLLGEDHAHRVYPEQRIPTRVTAVGLKSPKTTADKPDVYGQVQARAAELTEGGKHAAQAFSEAYREIVTTPEAAASFNAAQA